MDPRARAEFVEWLLTIQKKAFDWKMYLAKSEGGAERGTAYLAACRIEEAAEEAAKELGGNSPQGGGQ